MKTIQNEDITAWLISMNPFITSDLPFEGVKREIRVYIETENWSLREDLEYNIAKKLWDKVIKQVKKGKEIKRIEFLSYNPNEKFTEGCYELIKLAGKIDTTNGITLLHGFNIYKSASRWYVLYANIWEKDLFL